MSQYTRLPGFPKINRTQFIYGAAGLLLTSIVIVGYQLNFLNKIDQSLSTFRNYDIGTEKRAYATFLSTNTSWDAEDHYYTATRTMIYKMMKDPETRTRLDTDFLVIVNSNVDQKKIDRLKEDGAIVRFVEDIKVEWSKPGSERWVDQFTKLRLWEMTDWDRIMYIDSDMIILKNLDGLWLDPATMPQSTLRFTATDPSDEAPSPHQYIMGGIDDQGGNHHTPPEPSNVFNGGFFVMKPSKQMFNKYMSILSIPDRFDTGAMEQNMLNYAHRANGPMPWQRLIPGAWNTNHPDLDDWNYGTATLHNKFWPGSGESPAQMKFRYVDDVRRMRMYYNEEFEYQKEWDELSKKLEDMKKEDSTTDSA
jgi:alpha-N-acetylglucosamine transferase